MHLWYYQKYFFHVGNCTVLANQFLVTITIHQTNTFYNYTYANPKTKV